MSSGNSVDNKPAGISILHRILLQAYETCSVSTHDFKLNRGTTLAAGESAKRSTLGLGGFNQTPRGFGFSRTKSRRSKQQVNNWILFFGYFPLTSQNSSEKNNIIASKSLSYVQF